MRNLWVVMGGAMAAAVLTVGLTGCATPIKDERLRAGVSTGTEVVQYYGKPNRIWPEADGGRTLEYASQPFGQTCYMVRLDAQDHFVSAIDALAPAQRDRIQPGMTPDQVTRLLGRERSRVFFSNSGEDVWDWNVPPEMNGYLLRFNVHFKGGVVLRTSMSVVYPDKRFLWD